VQYKSATTGDFRFAIMFYLKSTSTHKIKLNGMDFCVVKEYT